MARDFDSWIMQPAVPGVEQSPVFGIFALLMKVDIRKLTFAELQDWFANRRHPAFRSKQVHEWLWKKSCTSIPEMSNLSLELRNSLDSFIKTANNYSACCLLGQSNSLSAKF